MAPSVLAKPDQGAVGDFRVEKARPGRRRLVAVANEGVRPVRMRAGIPKNADRGPSNGIEQAPASRTTLEA